MHAKKMKFLREWFYLIQWLHKKKILQPTVVPGSLFLQWGQNYIPQAQSVAQTLTYLLPYLCLVRAPNLFNHEVLSVLPLRTYQIQPFLVIRSAAVLTQSVINSLPKSSGNHSKSQQYWWLYSSAHTGASVLWSKAHTYFWNTPKSGPGHPLLLQFSPTGSRPWQTLYPCLCAFEAMCLWLQCPSF